ncbi:restriction endonuclease subunit S [Kiritimatiella glycovorans]|nr:restriction endonuclease subunit S [Kiritimatiella glycovorans]
MMEQEAMRDASLAYSVEARTAIAEDVPPGYKRTEVGVIPEDWSVKTVSEFGQVITGGTPSTKVRAYWGDAYPWVTPTDISTNKDICSTERHLSEAGFRVMRGLPANTVLVTCIASIGKNAVLRTPGSCNQQINAVIPDRDYDSDFLYYLFEFSKNYLIGSAGTTATSIISKSLFSSLAFALPAIREQRAIATALSDADALIESLDRLIAKKRAIKQAAMQQLLTGQTRLPGFTGEWETTRLGEIAEIVMGQSPGSAFYNAKGEGLPLIQGNADIENRQTIRRISTTQITKKGRRGDILLSVRAPVGEVSRATFDVCLGRGVCALRFPTDFLFHYLVYLEPSWGKHSKGSTFDSVNSADIKALEVALPGTEEQTAIATVLSDMDTEIEALERRRDKARQIKQGMMQQLLTGRVRLVEPESPTEAKA